MNASLLTGDDRYMQVWRRQNELINQQARTIDRQLQTPRMYRRSRLVQLRARSVSREWRSRSGTSRCVPAIGSWPAIIRGLLFSKGATPTILSKRNALAFNRVRERIAAMQADTTTPETRLADNAIEINPASVTALIQLTQGGLHIARPPWSSTSPHQGGAPLHCRLRYFDPRATAGPVCRRMSLRWSMSSSADQRAVTLVNLNPVSSRAGNRARRRLCGASHRVGDAGWIDASTSATQHLMWSCGRAAARGCN